MKYDGRNLGRYTGAVTIVREEADGLAQFSIQVQQLPITWQEQCERQLPPPTPPIVGKKYVNGEEQPKYDREDPAYVAEYDKWQHRCWAKKIYDATIDERVKFETDPGLLDTNPGEFYDGVFNELLEAFSRGEIQRWLLTINAIDQVGGADVALAEEGLFQEIQRLLSLPGVEADEAGGG